MIPKLTAENILDSIGRYIELTGKRAELDQLIAAGQTHDTSEFACAVYELAELEEALLAGGVFRWSADEAVSWAARKI